MENMEDLYEMVIRFFTTYGWQLGIIALSGIVLLGVRAAFRAIFGKIVDRLKSSKDKRIEDSAAKAEANNTETATATPSTEQVAEVRTVKAKKAVQATAVNVEPVAKTKVSKKDI